MKIHIPDKKPDWELTPAKQRTAAQRLAVATSGAITPGNIISCFGVIVVTWGVVKLHGEAWSTGLTLIIIGRALDVLDGYIADMTKTKSRVGETVDALCDKITVLIILIATLATHTLNPVLLLLVFLHHLYTGIFGLVWGRRYNLHSSKTAKYAAFVSWLAIIGGLAGQHYAHNPWVYIPADILIVVYIGFIGAAINSYRSTFRQIANK